MKSSKKSSSDKSERSKQSAKRKKKESSSRSGSAKKRRTESTRTLHYYGDNWTLNDDILLVHSVSISPFFEDIVDLVEFSTTITDTWLEERWSRLLRYPFLREKIREPNLPACSRMLDATTIQTLHTRCLARIQAAEASSGRSRKREGYALKIGESSGGFPGLQTAVIRPTLHNVSYTELQEQILSESPPNNDKPTALSTERMKQYTEKEAQHQKDILTIEKVLEKDIVQTKTDRNLAILRSNACTYEMKTKEVVIGRSSKSFQVDVDVANEKEGRTVSRTQVDFTRLLS